MGSSSPVRPYEDQPGPGKYDPKIISKTVLGHINPSPQRPQTARNSPGPGAYNPNETIVRLSSPKYKFSRNLNLVNRSVELIGPGSYNLKTHIGEGVRYSISPSRYYSPINKNPGPSYYNPNNGLTLLDAPHWKFSNNPRGNHEGP